MNIKKNIKVSVIVSVYNAEKYLHQCIGSILNQTLKNIEIILVNDGSTDSSLSICREFEKNDSRVIVVNKKNGGTGTAYNSGLLKSHGEYIGFMDSDDWIEKKMYEKLYEIASEKNADIVRCDFFKYNPAKRPYSIPYTHGNAKPSLIYPENKIFSLKDAPLILAQRMVAWSGIFKHEFIKNMRFIETPGPTYQDFVFMMGAFIKAKRILLCYDRLIHYRLETHRETATQNPSDINVYYLIKNINRVKKMLQNKRFLPKYSEEFYYNITQVFCSFWFLIKQDRRNDFYRAMLDVYKDIPHNFKYKYFERGFRLFVDMVLKDKKGLFAILYYK